MHIPVVIAGGGILGLTLACELRKKYPSLDIVLFEKEQYLGEHSTSRNSGVLHAGIYYPTNSLKHLLCIEGNRLWKKKSKEYGLEVKDCGKFVVACTDHEVLPLEDLFSQAIKNEVPGIDWCHKNQLEEIKNFVHVKKAFFSKSTSILNISQTIKTLENYLFKNDVPIMLSNEIKNLKNSDKKIHIETQRESFSCDFFFNLTGSFAPKLRKLLNLHDLENYPVKGNYLKLTGPYYNNSLVYPVPSADLKGLGVHTSFDFDGLIRFGPNTEEVDCYDFKMKDDLVELMWPAIKKIFKNVDPSKLSADYCGIRSKIKLNGSLYTDFWIKGPNDLNIDGYFECCGIESPGLTASWAITNMLINKMESSSKDLSNYQSSC